MRLAGAGVQAVRGGVARTTKLRLFVCGVSEETGVESCTRGICGCSRFARTAPSTPNAAMAQAT